MKGKEAGQEPRRVHDAVTRRRSPREHQGREIRAAGGYTGRNMEEAERACRPAAEFYGVALHVVVANLEYFSQYQLPPAIPRGLALDDAAAEACRPAAEFFRIPINVVGWFLDTVSAPFGESKTRRYTGAAPPSKPAVTARRPRMRDDFNTQEGVGARLLRELSPSQLAAVIEDSPLARRVARYEKQLREIELPEGGFTTKAQADAAGALATTLRDLQNVQVGLGVPITEMPERVREAIRLRSAYVKHHTKTGEVIAARPRGRPRRVASGNNFIIAIK